MQRLIIYCALVLAAAWVTGVAGAADYKLKDGTTLSGEAIGPNEKSVIIKAPDGKLLPRTPWANFSQEALKEFAKNPKIRAFVELLIEEPVAGAAGAGSEPEVPEVPLPKRPPAKFMEVQAKPQLPESPGLFAGMFTTGVGWLGLVAMYAATIFAGYEVAHYRRRPQGLVMGLAAIPFLGVASPIAFLVMPPVRTEEEKKPTAVEQAAKQNQEAAKEEAKPKGMALGKAKPATARPVATAKPVAHAAAPAAAPAPVAPAPAPAPAAPAGLTPAVFRRGETNINKRFIETKFAGFFKLVPGPAERDMWLVWVCPRGEFWSKRVVSINQTEVVVNCPQENGGSMDETLQIVEIQEIHLRPQEG